jgi:hypothetical protein
MALANDLDDRRSGCQQQLMRLRILARSREDAALSREASSQVRDATNAVIAEAEVMSRTALRVGRPQELQAETFLWVRIARLAAAADRAVDAARSRDVPALRHHLRQFDALTSAIWGVQHPSYGI